MKPRRLCQSCCEVISHIREDLKPWDLGEWRVKGTLQSSTQALYASGECTICLRLVSLLPSEHEVTDTDRPLEWSMKALKVSHKKGNINYEPHEYGIQLGFLGPKFGLTYLIELSDYDPGSDTYTREINPTFDMDYSIRFASGWLDECLQKHTGTCGGQLGVAGAWTPSRLLDVEDNIIADDFTGISVDISLREGISGVPYLTLTYRWGKTPPLRLLGSNIDAFRRRIRLDILPKTFRDAVVFTRRLGFRYLWIDSLCIIQDSQDDWRRESRQMGDIYSNAACNLAAAGARNSDGGLYFPFEGQPRLWPNSMVVQVKPDLGPSRNLVMREGMTIALPEAREKLEEDSVSALCGRAWVMQEELLSPRILTFGQKLLLFECKFLSPVNIPREQRSISKDIQKPSHLSLPMWENVINMYNTCDITRPRDKLPALSGLAQRYQREVFRCPYSAGLWRTGLIFQLQWYVTAGIRRPDFGVPSWSWASCQGSVGNIRSHPTLKPTILATLEAVHVEFDRSVEDGFGEIEWGVLKLLGRLMPCNLGPPRASGNAMITFGINDQVNYKTPCALYMDDHHDAAGIASYFARHHAFEREDSLAAICERMPFNHLYCFPLIAYCTELGFSDFRWDVRALLLVPVEKDRDGKATKFQRVGLVRFDVDWTMALYRIWEEAERFNQLINIF